MSPYSLAGDLYIDAVYVIVSAIGFDIDVIVSQFGQDLVRKTGVTDISHTVSAIVFAVPVGVVGLCAFGKVHAVAGLGGGEDEIPGLQFFRFALD